MAEPVEFPEADKTEDYAPPHPSRPLPVKVLPGTSVSCWSLGNDEREQIAQTGLIWLTTQTFKALDPEPNGERHQPAVSLTTDKAKAFSGWPAPPTRAATPGIAALPADAENVVEARAALRSLSDSLSTGNDLGGLSIEEAEEARREVMILEHAFACEGIAVDWLRSLALGSGPIDMSVVI